MARMLFGGSSDDYAVGSDGKPVTNRRVRFYTSAAMTTEITDLASDAAGTGTPLAVFTNTAGFWGPVYGPDGVTVMYAGTIDAQSNPPTYVVAVYAHYVSEVASFNGRNGAVTLTKGDVTGTGLAASDIGVSTGLTPTATKTAAYTAVVGDLAMMNVAGGGTALTLPTAPADKAQVGYRAIGATAAVPLTVTAGGSDTIGISGATSTTIGLADETVVLQYQATGTRWIAVANVKTQTSLFTESIQTFAASGAAITLGDPVTTGTMKDVTLTANCTITLPAAGAGKSFLVRLTQDVTGGRTATFVLAGGGSPKWGASGVAPTLTATANAQDEIAFHSWGTSWTGGLANKDIR